VLQVEFPLDLRARTAQLAQRAVQLAQIVVLPRQQALRASERDGGGL